MTSGPGDARYPTWWDTDPEHAPAIMALALIHRSHHIRPAHADSETELPGSWIIDFEAAWNEPLSSGERILVAHAWCLYNLGWAHEVEGRAWEKHGASDWDYRGPVYWSNPSCAAGTLGGRHLDCYLQMIDVRLGRET